MSRDDEGTVVVAEPEAAPTPNEATPQAPITTPEVTEEPVNDGSAPVATDATTATSEPTAEELAEKAKAEAAATQELLDTFEAVVTTAVESADPSTADLPQEQVDAVKASYGALPAGSARTRAKKFLNDRMRAEIGEAHVVQAKAFMTLEDAVKSQKAASDHAVKEPVDPTVAQVEHAAALFISANFVIPGPGVAEDWATQATKLASSLTGEVGTYREYLTQVAAWEADTRPTEAPDGTPEGTEVDLKGAAPAEPEVSDVIRLAARIAQGRTAAPRKAREPKPKADGTTPAPRVARSGERRDIKAHIQEVFADKAVGTFLKFGEIAKAVTSVAPAGDTSQGAVSARNKPSWNVPNLVFVTQDGAQGIRKVA